MQLEVTVASTGTARRLSLPPSLRTAVCCGALLALSPVLLHAADNVVTVDAALIATLETRALQAPQREQAQMFADLVDKISVLADRQIAEGEADKAEETLHKLESCSARIEAGLSRDSKGLKKTELLLHTTNRRLSDLVRRASGDMKPMVANALRRLNATQTSLLSAVFEK